ncbi:MAG TPA: CDP-alcohol phosphatidyltransferase family protein [Acidimicrobiales bacterium]|nr:CDP-alcohol phosphatidyltransferase family protein [Acidimicrobiales bacterium]
MFDARWRSSLERGTQPVGQAIRRMGATADHLTVAGLVLAVATAVAVGAGRLGLGLALLIAASLPDLLDGAVAKAAGTASPRGAFFDSVADRVSDSLVLGGLAWYLASRHGGHAAVLALAVLAASTLVSYERARAGSLGFTAKGGLMERGERVFAIGVGLAFSWLLVPVLWIMLVLTVVTAVQRFVMVWRQASVPRPTAPVGRWRPSRVELRWRSWREAAGPSAQPGARWRARRQEWLGARADRRRARVTRP